MSYKHDFNTLKKNTLRQIKRRNLNIPDWEYRCKRAMDNSRRFVFLALSWVANKRGAATVWTMIDILDDLMFATKMRLLAEGLHRRSDYYNDIKRLDWSKK